MLLRPLLAVSIAALSLGAFAQTPAPAAAATLVPASTCVKPEYTSRLASDPTAFNQQFKTYGECVKQYVDRNRSIAEAATAAANRAVDEYNGYTAEVKAKIEAEKSDRQKDKAKP